MSDEDVIEKAETEADRSARVPARELVQRRERAAGRPPAAETEALAPIIYQHITDGLTDTEIARLTGVDRKAVAYYRTKSQRPVRKTSIGHVPGGAEGDRALAEMMRLFGEGLTYLQIAEQLGLSYQTVRAKLSKAYASYLESIKETVAGRQYADIQMMKEELLEIIIRDHAEELKALQDQAEGIDEFDEFSVHSLVEKAFQKGRKNVDTKFKAMEVFLKLMEREAKIFGIDAASQVNVSHTVKVDPSAIPLLARIEEKRAGDDDVLDAEIVEEEFDLGSSDY